jgi:serine kinase of HPr protein (carbohydrate metabolism regulator)
MTEAAPDRGRDARPAGALDSTPTIHASAVLAGPRAVLIRGPSGSGKSRLASALLDAWQRGPLPFARLVGDDRVHVEAVHARLLVRPAPALAGLIEIRGLGIRRLPYEPLAVVGLVVDLSAPDAARLPSEGFSASIAGVPVPRLAVAAGESPLPLVLARLAAGLRPAGPAG